MIHNIDILETLHEQLERLGRISLNASGKSMGGRFEKADQFKIESAKRRKPRTGDIVVVNHENQWKIHRLLCRFPHGRCITMGDTMHAADRPAPEQRDIVGVVTALRVNGKTQSLTGPLQRFFHLWPVLRSLGRLIKARVRHAKARKGAA